MKVSQIVDRALEHINVKESGQATSYEDAEMCLRALISMLDSWQLDPQVTIGQQEFVYSPSTGQRTVTIGAAGDIVAKPPVRFELSSFLRRGNVDTPIGVANSLDEYNAQAVKGVAGPTRFIYYVRNNEGAGTIYLSPAADGTSELHLWARQDVIDGYEDLALTSDITLPNGYRNALEWCLAAEIAGNFDQESPNVARRASNALRKLKRSNFVSAQIQPVVGILPRQGTTIQFASDQSSGGNLDGGSA